MQNKTYPGRDSGMAKTKKREDLFIPCHVDKGLFSNELSVEFELYETPFSMFAPKDSVVLKGELPGEGLLRVSVVEKKKGLNLIELPAETIQQGRRFMRVYPDVLVSG